jgi:hypothetical protein
MQTTPFAGLTALDPGESLSGNGYAFQGRDRQVIDRLLQVGAVTHRHDGHGALGDPTAAPAVNAFAGNGGAIGPGVSISVGYTLLDGLGGETQLSETATVSTPEPVPAPDDVPTSAVVTSSGALRAGLYYYVVTLKDAAGGETTAGPVLAVTIPQGSDTNTVRLTGLAGLVDPAAPKWVVYRSSGGGRMEYLREGTADVLVDDGIACANSIFPPETNTTRGNSFLQATVPALDEGPAGFRLYVDADGGFESPCLFGEYPLASAGAPIRVNSLDVLDGAPPLVSTCVPGAQPISVEDIEGLTWGPPVADAASLPTTGVADGHARVVLSSPPSIHIWSDGAWTEVSGGGGGGGYVSEAPAAGGVEGGPLAGFLERGTIAADGTVLPTGAVPQEVVDYYEANGIPASAYANLGVGIARSPYLASTTRGFIGKVVGADLGDRLPQMRLRMMSGLGLVASAEVALNVSWSYDYAANTVQVHGSLYTASSRLDPAVSTQAPAGFDGSPGPSGYTWEYGVPMPADVWLGAGQEGSVLRIAMWLTDPFAPGSAPVSVGTLDLAGTSAHSAFDLPLTSPTIAFTGDKTQPFAGKADPLVSSIWWGEKSLLDLAAPQGRRLLIGFPDAPASAAIVYDEATGHSPWELQDVKSGAVTVTFPKSLDLVAGPGVNIDLVDDGDGHATITIGLT